MTLHRVAARMCMSRAQRKRERKPTRGGGRRRHTEKRQCAWKRGADAEVLLFDLN